MSATWRCVVYMIDSSCHRGPVRQDVCLQNFGTRCRLGARSTADFPWHEDQWAHPRRNPLLPRPSLPPFTRYSWNVVVASVRALPMFQSVLSSFGFKLSTLVGLTYPHHYVPLLPIFSFVVGRTRVCYLHAVWLHRARHALFAP